jgi:hypothetical protein
LQQHFADLFKHSAEQSHDERNALVQTAEATKGAMPAADQQRKEEEDLNFSIVKPDSSKLDPIAMLLFAFARDNEQHVEVTLKKLADTCHYELDNNFKHSSDEIAKLGGHLAIVTAMVKGTSSPSIQTAACFALLNSLADKPSELCNVAVKVGAVKTILAAMKTFKKDERLQLNRCVVLINIVSNMQNAEHFVTKLEGFSMEISAMKEFPKNTKVGMLDFLQCKPMA